MVDKNYAHNLAAQIVSSFCQGGKLPIFPDDVKGDRIGRYLGGVYQELYKQIVATQVTDK